MSQSISTPMAFKNYKVFKYTYAGRPLVIEHGKLAGLANGSVLVRYGETVILCCATASAKPRDGIDFLPLSVDYEENPLKRQFLPPASSTAPFVPFSRRICATTLP